MPRSIRRLYKQGSQTNLKDGYAHSDNRLLIEEPGQLARFDGLKQICNDLRIEVGRVEVTCILKVALAFSKVVCCLLTHLSLISSSAFHILSQRKFATLTI